MTWEMSHGAPATCIISAWLSDFLLSKRQVQPNNFASASDCGGAIGWSPTGMDWMHELGTSKKKKKQRFVSSMHRVGNCKVLVQVDGKVE